MAADGRNAPAQGPGLGTYLADPGEILTGITFGEVGVWRWDVASDRIAWSPNLEKIHGLGPGSFDGTFAFFLKDIHPDDRERVAGVLGAARAGGTPYHVEYRLPAKAGGEERWLEARGNVIIQSAQVTVMSGICQDITERKRTEQELERRVRQAEMVAELGQLALKDGPLATLFETAAREACRLLGCEFCKVLELMPSGAEFLLRSGYGWEEGLIGVEHVPADHQSQAGYTLTQGSAVIVEDLATEVRFKAADLLLRHKVVSGMSVIIGGDDSRPFGVFGVHSRSPKRFRPNDADFVRAVANILANAVSRQQATDRQVLLMRELRHRVGNLLTLVISLFNNSVYGAENIDELSEKFIARVMSLSRAHTFISYGGWSTASLGRLVREVLEPYLDRVEILGADIRVRADAGFALSIALHELASNAARHGGLSSPAGALRLSWRVVREGTTERFAMDWIESGNESVSAPKRRGFGLRLIDTVIKEQIGGQIAIDYRPEGIAVRMTFPLEALTQ